MGGDKRWEGVCLAREGNAAETGRVEAPFMRTSLGIIVNAHHLYFLAYMVIIKEPTETRCRLSDLLCTAL